MLSFENKHSLFFFFNLMKKLHFSTPLALLFKDFFLVHVSMNFYFQSVTDILAFSKINEERDFPGDPVGVVKTPRSNIGGPAQGNRSHMPQLKITCAAMKLEDPVCCN